MRTDTRDANDKFARRSMHAGRLVRTLLTPLAIAFPPLFWVIDATRRQAVTTLGRDQGIFQYVAWALRHGAVDYRDIRDVNGPLTHFIHGAFLALGGGDEHRFRVLDLTVTGASYAIAGACLPGLARASAHAGAGRAAPRPRPAVLERVAWAFAAWVVLSAQYLLYSWWDSAQRESFFDWFLLTSLGLQLVAQAPLGRRPRDAAGDAAGPSPRSTAGAAHPSRRDARDEWRSLLLVGAVGALSVAPWFGKPTYALFTVLQVSVLLADRAAPLTLGKRLLAFAAGGAAAAAVLLGLLAWRGDVLAYLRIQFVDVPAMYRFIWPRTAAEILAPAFYETHAVWGAIGAVTLVGLVVTGEMPVRVLAVALTPIAAVAAVVLQAKGFPYHFHPLTASVYLQWLLGAAWLTERTRVTARRHALLRLLPLGAAALLASHVATALEDAPALRDPWLLWGGRNAVARASAGYFEHFNRVDYFPNELRQAAAYLRDHTAPDETVQQYGMDPYLLFLAQRLSATPYLYAYDLDLDTALAGGTAGVPNEGQSSRIRAMGEAHTLDLTARIEARPPAAFVFIDDSPLLSEKSAWDDFEDHCPAAAAWVEGRYRESATFGHDHVWLRNDLSP